ncbi:MAG: hypothetical protein U0V87_15760 [Acidobacteriota bacterium]
MIGSAFLSGSWHVVHRPDHAARASRGIGAAPPSDRWSREINGRGFAEGNAALDSQHRAQFDAVVGVRISSAAEIQLLGRNLSDKAYFASPDDVSDFAPGRSAELSLRGKF